VSYTKREFYFTSSDGISRVYAEICVPDVPARAVILLSHGMIDHVGRYEYLKEEFTRRGFIVAGNDHIGHGRTAPDADSLGVMPKEGAYRIVDDLYTVNRTLAEEFPHLPRVLLGHSMGSFMARLYAARYGESIDGIIIHGTGGKNPALGAGKMLVNLIAKFKGDGHRSELVRSLAFGAYNKRFDPEEGPDAWLTTRSELVRDRATDPYTTFTFSLSGYRELFRALGECNSKKHFDAYPKELPTLVISGADDPVGDYGKGTEWVHGQLYLAGVRNLTLKLYDGARHELFNESCRAEAAGYMADWINERVIARK